MAERTRDEMLAEAEAKRAEGDSRPASQIVAEDMMNRAGEESQEREQVGVPRDKAEGAQDAEGRPNP